MRVLWVSGIILAVVLLAGFSQPVAAASTGTVNVTVSIRPPVDPEASEPSLVSYLMTSFVLTSINAGHFGQDK